MTRVPPRSFLSRAEVARLFDVSPVTVARWADQGKLPYEVTLGGRRRYPRAGTLAIVGRVRRGVTPAERPRPAARSRGADAAGGAAKRARPGRRAERT